MTSLALFFLLLLVLAFWVCYRIGGSVTPGELGNEMDREPRWQGQESRILDTLNTVPWEWDLDEGRYTFIGKRMETLFGYPLAQWYESKLWRDSLHPEDVEMVERSFMRAVWNGGKGAYSYRVIHADGTTIQVESVITTVVKDGNPRFVCGTTRCI